MHRIEEVKANVTVVVAVTKKAAGRMFCIVEFTFCAGNPASVKTILVFAPLSNAFDVKGNELFFF